MTPERWQKVKQICHLALDRDPGGRAGFLAEACSGDEGLRQEVESMLGRITTEGISDGPIWEKLGVVNAEAERWIPATVGSYRILRVLGEGGMGVVYEAEQDQPRRIVALKVIKPGFASLEMLRRFERESEALARLHHSGIAQIYQAGTADSALGQQPYFAMEFIQGTPLRQYAQAHQLNTRQRLELMAKIGDAVEHAHQRGIIHRDLKPGNILVEEGGQPKILDFGVARVTDSDAQATRQTDLGQLVGTLAYMSPEQVLADPLELDTRSDVYALGVILYELLAGKLPYQVSNRLPEAVRTILEEDPSRLSSVNRAYRGDVETIVAKALEKDKARRYASASALAEDIRRYLGDQPVGARPASTTYQLQKFAKRHKALVGATAAVFVVLLAGVIVSTREAVLARRAEQTAQAVNEFLQRDLLAQAGASTQASPSTKPDPDLKVRTALDRAATKIEGEFKEQPEVEAAIRDTIAETYMDLGLYPESRIQLERTLELQRRLLGVKDAATLRTISHLGSIASHQGKYDEAKALLRQAIDLQSQVLGPEHPETLRSLNDLAMVYQKRDMYREAQALYEQVVKAARRVLGPEHPNTLIYMNNLADLYQDQAKYAEAEVLNRQILEIRQRLFGPEHPSTLISMDNLASSYYEQHKYAQAESLNSRSVEIQKRVLGLEHPDTLISMSILSNVYFMQGKYPQAEAIDSQVLQLRQRVLGAEHADTLATMNNLADDYTFAANYAQAEPLFSETLERSVHSLGSEASQTLSVLADFATMYQRNRRYTLAESRAAQALAGRRHALGSEDARTMVSAADLALAYVSQEKFTEAEPLAHEATEFYRSKQPDDWQRYRAESLLGASLAGERKYSEAEPLLVDGYQGMLARKSEISVPDQYHLNLSRKWLVQCYQAWGKPDKAAEWRKK